MDPTRLIIRDRDQEGFLLVRRKGDVHGVKAGLVDAARHQMKGFQFLAGDLSACEGRGSQGPKQLEDMVIETLVDESGFLAMHGGDVVYADRRRLADLLEREGRQVECDVREPLVLQHALRRAEKGSGRWRNRPRSSVWSVHAWSF